MFAQIPPGMLKAIENEAWKTQKWNLNFAQFCQNLVKMKHTVRGKYVQI